MKTLETERLILRPHKEDDFEFIHNYASCYENIKYMVWGPNEDADTRAFIKYAIAKSVEEPCENYQYAAKACRLLVPVMNAHGMKKITISNEKDNISSKRTCEKIGAKLLRVAKLPEWTELYVEGQRYVNVYEWITE